MVNYLLVALVLNIVFGGSVYVIWRYAVLCDNDTGVGLYEALGYSAVNSVVFMPICIYILRLVNLDNGLNILIITSFLFAFSIYLLIKRRAEIKNKCQYMYIYIYIIECGIFLALWVAFEGKILGYATDNALFDAVKHYGMLISCVGSNGIHINHPFASGYSAIYYLFYYYRLAEPLKILSYSSSINSIPALCFLDELLIAFCFIFLLDQIAIHCGKVSKPYRIFILTLPLLDGGMDSIWFFLNKNSVPAIGYIDDWTRLTYENAIAHSNFMTKLIWEPQHVCAIIPVLLVFLLMMKSIDEERILQTGENVLIGLCLLCVLGTSTQIAILFYVIIGLFLLITVIRDKDHLLKYVFVYGGCGLLGVPLLLYLSQNSRTAISVRDVSFFIQSFSEHPGYSIGILVIEFGVVFIVFLMTIFSWKNDRRHQKLNGYLLAAIVICLFSSFMFYMKGINDIGMQWSFFLYTMLLIFCLINDNYQNCFYSGWIIPITCCLLLGGITNLKSFSFHSTMNRPETAINNDDYTLYDWMCTNTGYSDSAVYLTDDEGVLWRNRMIPQTFHTLTFYPLYEGVQYLSQADSDRLTKEFLNSFSEMTIEHRKEFYEKNNIDYFVVISGSVGEHILYHGHRLLFKNSSWSVYDAKECSEDEARSSWGEYAEPYQLGTTLHFDAAAYNAGDYLKYGFSGKEEWGTWTDGDEAVMLLRTDEKAAMIEGKIRIGGAAYHPQRVVIQVNGDEVYHETIDEALELSFRFDAPEDGVIEVKILLPDSVRPSDVTESLDTRDLGIGIQEITLSRANNT